jgi:predicted HicB family RNase H-like nuclease
MSGKKVNIGLKPGVQKRAEEWVGESSKEVVEKAAPAPAPSAVVKRLTIDVSEDLHRQLKIKAASEGVRMADLVREWISEKCA